VSEPVGLEDLAGHVDRALPVAAAVERPQFAQVVFEDADAAGVTALLQALADHRGRCRIVFGEHVGDRVPERLELRACRTALVARRLGEAGQTVDSRATAAQLLGDALLGNALADELPDLGPIVHLIHPFLPSRVCPRKGSTSVVTLRSVQFSTGAECSVLGRRRHSRCWAAS